MALKVIETLADIKAMDFGMHMGFMRVMMEGDALNIVNRIIRTTPNLSNIGLLVEEARTLMRRFQLCSTQCDRREANIVPHTLAQIALSLDNDLYWVDECPESVMALIANDYNPCLK